MPMVPIPGTLEENINAAFTQEICKRLVLFGQPLELTCRHKGTGSGHLRCAAQRPYEVCDAVEDRMRPVLKLAFIKDEGPGLQNQSAKDTRIAEGG